MKESKTRILLFLVIFYSQVGYSQKFTTGIYSGVNISDIHGQDYGGKWASKPGPAQGIYLNWLFSRSFGLQTGLGFSTVYYEHRTTYNPVFYVSPSYYNDLMPVYYPTTDKMDFSFLRLPLLLTVSIPSSIQFNMKAGVVFSFLTDHSLGSYYNYSYSVSDNIKKNDFGYLFSSGISYPLGDRIRISFNVTYLTGRKKFMDYSNMKHGSSEYTLGIEYEFNKKDKTFKNPGPESDSASKRVTITYYGGLNVSWNPLRVDGKKYSPFTGPVLGFTVDIPLGHGSSIISGFSFVRKGYSMKDSSSLFYRYLKDDKPAYAVDTKVQADYAIIPFLLNIPLGKSQKMYFNTGPWLGLRLNARNVGIAYNENRSESSYTIQKTIIYNDIEKLIKADDAGWIFGFGVSVPVIKNYKVDVSLQYSISFNDDFNSSAEGYEQNNTNTGSIIRFRTISLLLGIKMP
jgi:opacity protein-like surface antigen